MKYKYVEAYAIKGLVGPREEELIIKDENFTAYLVSNPDQELDVENAQRLLTDYLKLYIDFTTKKSRNF